MNPYETLGVEPGATLQEIRRAYRRLAQELHPDKLSGDAGEFVMVQLAWDILSDPERRAQYDRDGTTERPTVPDKVLIILAKLMEACINDISDPDVSNPLSMARTKLHIRLGENDLHQQMQAKAKQKFDKVLSRLKNGPREDRLREVLEGQRQCVLDVMEKIETETRDLRQVLDLLSEYDYDVSQPATFPSTYYTLGA